MDPNAQELSVMMHQTGVGVLVVYGMEALKKIRWFPWISQYTGHLNRIIGLIVAFVTTMGVKWAVTGSMFSTDGMHIGITIPALPVLFDSLVHIAGQFGGQELLYQAAVHPKPEKFEGPY